MSKNNKKEDMVIYHNDYIEALYQVDLLAKKIMLASSLICRDSDWTDKGCEVIVSSNELYELVAIKKNSLKHLEAAVKKLVQTTVTVKNPKDPKDFVIFNYLPRGEYNNGELKLTINIEMKKFIQDLQKNYTQYHIENIKPLKSEYSIRIFELLKRNAFKKKKITISIKELRKMFGLENSYTDYNMFKKRVIEKAKLELKEHCEIYFEYREIKTGRKVTAIEFKIFQQIKDFSVVDDDIINVTINDSGINKETSENILLEKQLNELGWKGDFVQLTEQISPPVIENYYKILQKELDEIDMQSIDGSQLQKYIDESLKTQAQRYYNISSSVNKIKTKKVSDDKQSKFIVEKLYKLGFNGNAENFVKKEGIELIEEALLSFKNAYTPNVTNKIGLLRSILENLKHVKKLEQIEKEEKHLFKEKSILDKITKYKNLNKDFSEDYSRFVQAPSNSNEMDRKILEKYRNLSVEDMPEHILKEFIDWVAV